MNRVTAKRRGAALTTGAALSALALVATFAGPTAQAAPPAEDCAASFPVADVAAGSAVTGLTVSSGTTPTGFTGEVLGVLDDGIAPGLDMVIARLSSPEIDRVGGIWAGMSGSPVYAADGRLLGAVAYGLSFGASPVAGITPFEDMDDYLAAADAAAPDRIRVGDQTAQRIARGADVTVGQARQGFSQLRMPWGVSGVRAGRLADLDKAGAKRPWVVKNTYALGAAAPTRASAAGPESIVAGGNLAASVSYGDLTMAGVGTATSVCRGRVVGFGHPLAFFGSTSLFLHPASAIYVQEESLGAPFKVANVGAPAGTVTDDRLTGITGTFGTLPPSTTVSSTVTYRGRSRTGTSQVPISDYLAEVTYLQVVANHDRVLDGIVKGSELNSWTIRGTNPRGRSFSLQWVDRYRSTDNVSEEGAFELADFVWGLTSLSGVSIQGVEAGSAVTDDTDTWKVTAVQQKRGRAWRTVSLKEPAVVAAGTKLKMRAVLSGQRGSKKRLRVHYRIPKRASGSVARMQFVGGGAGYDDESYVELTSVRQARRVLAKAVRNDAVAVTFDTSGQGPGSSSSSASTKRLGPTGRVVTGSKQARVRIR